MTSSERMGLIYALSFGGAAAYSYIKKGKRDLTEVGTDALVYGGMVGTGINVAFWLQANSGHVAVPVALPNKGQEKCKPMGKIAVEGVNLLSALNPDVLYKAAHKMGVKIGPEPDDIYRVVLPQD